MDKTPWSNLYAYGPGFKSSCGQFFRQFFSYILSIFDYEKKKVTVFMHFFASAGSV